MVASPYGAFSSSLNLRKTSRSIASGGIKNTFADIDPKNWLLNIIRPDSLLKNYKKE